MNNSDLINMYITSDKNLDKTYQNKSLSIYYNKLYSYNTIISQYEPNNNIYIVSLTDFSVTTAKHLLELKSQLNNNYIELPNFINNHNFTINDVITLENRIKRYINDDIKLLNQADFRFYFTRLVNNYKKSSIYNLFNHSYNVDLIIQAENIINHFTRDLKEFRKYIKQQTAKQVA